MENVQADLGLSMGKDEQEPLQCGTNIMEDGQQQTSSPIINEFASFTFVSFLFTLALVNRLLHEFMGLKRSVDQF